MDPSLSSISLAPPPPPIVPVIATSQTTTIAGGLPPSFSHPPYSDMICEAIGALKESDGSSKKAIASDVSTGPKRGRGRPPKPKAADFNPQQQAVPFSDVPKRPPGRPRKSGPVGQIGVIRSQGRGRPPKSGHKKSPGRPKKPKTVRSVVGASAMKRGRGRPPKASIQLPAQAVIPNYGQPVAVPYADSAAVTADVGVPSPRGRPKGTARAAAVVSLGKRRGRPPKIAGVTVKPMKTTGKPVGRPKKQSKVKQAVEALKPQFTNGSNSSAIDAILELEGLAAMDIGSTPSKAADAQLPPPPPLAAGQPPVEHDEGRVL
ncbi:basic salivary proline-rich protein 4-like isoform X2 [Hibiscus syriacus]|uniref:basic salivary proline-rich protein 4-like isoform X2 n=1 Tax=Hibiscus syriacus TaxID=106335 RepID=UPI0019205DF4|nr:basic salivary proline-rich protein 4-like isoform X2 [Hibiscus syriacus]